MDAGHDDRDREGGAGLDGPDLTDLGERRLEQRFEIQPGPLAGARRRGVAAVVVVVALVGILVAAMLGAGGAREPSGSPSASPTGTASTPAATPGPSASTDPCATDLAASPLPNVAVNQGGQFALRRQPNGTVDDVAAAGFEPPVDRTVEVQAGASMRLQIGDARCVVEVRADLHGVSLPGTDGLAVTLTGPLTDGRTYLFSGPPAGDWTLRVALRVTAPAAETGRWAIYFIRLNSGYVPYESPLPTGVGPGPDESPEPIETPALPCGTPPGDITTLPGGPPALPVDLWLPDGSRYGGVPATGQPEDWDADGFGRSVPEGLATRPAIQLDLDELITFRTANAVCAVRWQVDAGQLPSTGTAFEPWAWWAGNADNETRDPGVIAQNVMEATVQSSGRFALRLIVDIPEVGSEALFWLVDVAPLEAPVVTVTASDGTSVTAVRACGASYELPSGNFGHDPCPLVWPLLDDGPVLEVPAGSIVRVAAGGTPIIRWWAQYADRQTIVDADGLLDRVNDLADGGSQAGFASVEMPVPGADGSAPVPGTSAYGWEVQVTVTVRPAIGAPGGIVQVPYFLRIRVVGGCCD